MTINCGNEFACFLLVQQLCSKDVLLLKSIAHISCMLVGVSDTLGFEH